MSALGDYVHYQYSHLSNGDSPSDNAAYLAKTFSHDRVKKQYEISLKDLKAKLNTIYRQKIKINGKTIGEDEFFKLLSDIQNDGISKAAQEMANSIETAGVSRGDIASAEYDVQKLQEIVNRFSEVLEQITGGTFSTNPLPILTQEMLNGDTSIDAIKKTYRDAYLNNGTTFKVDNSYSRAIASHQGEINKMLANLSAIQAIEGGGMKSFGKETQSKTIEAFLFSTWNIINRMVGFVSEDKLAEYLPKYIMDKINVIDKNMKLVVSAEGTGSSSIFNKKTEDISIQCDIPKMVNGQAEGLISVRLPGITLKRTNVKNNVANIHIKSNATLSNFLDNAKISVPLVQFYNAFADYNMAIIKPGRKMKLPAELNKDAQNAMQDMYDYFHAAFLPLALAGSLDKDDFA
jgi:hypothetical protein